MQPDFAEAHTSLAHALLQSGEFTEGWAEYEWRWQTRSMLAGRRNFPQPQWRGEPGQARTLLVHAEQGFGDTLQFCRFAAGAAERGFRVILEVQKPLVRLLTGLPGVSAVIGRGDRLPAFDLHAPLLSLPWALGLTRASLTRSAPYLRPDPALRRIGKRGSAASGASPLAGLAWAGSHNVSNAAIDRPPFDRSRRGWRRYCKPQARRFVSLQKDGLAMPHDLAVDRPDAGGRGFCRYRGADRASSTW